jgi:hypothetical protein
LASKQSFCRHTVSFHDLELPGGGLFLMPDSSYSKQGGFHCDVCNKHFCRLDHFIAHTKTETHCRNLATRFEVAKFAVGSNHKPKAITAPDFNVKDKRIGNYLSFIYWRFSYI